MGVKGSLLSLGKTVARSLSLSPSLTPSLSSPLPSLSESLYAQTRPKAPNFIGVIKRRFIRLRSGDGEGKMRMRVRICGFPFPTFLPLFLRRRHECGLTNEPLISPPPRRRRRGGESFGALLSQPRKVWFTKIGASFHGVRSKEEKQNIFSIHLSWRKTGKEGSILLLDRL